MVSYKCFGYVGKCYSTRSVDYKYFVNRTRVIEEKSLKDLGVGLDSHLKFRDHIEYVNAITVKTIRFVHEFARF